MKTKGIKFAIISGLIGMFTVLLFIVMCSNDIKSGNPYPDLLSYEQFRSQASVETFNGHRTGIYIVDGHTPVDGDTRMDQLYEEYVKAYQQAFGLSIVDNVNGVDIVWGSVQKLQLTYCISNSFGARKPVVVQAMSDAALAWEGAANVRFLYVPVEDVNCSASNANVLFDVEPTSGQVYLARSFFPDSARPGRNLMVNDTSFGIFYPLSLAGIFRHEMGHILGLRHEHTRPESGTCFEDNQWRALTAYDSSSVMQYPQCNGTGNSSFILTDSDKAGIAQLYGAP